MGVRAPSSSSLLVLALAPQLAGCTQVRGRKTLQDANEEYKQGRYREAVRRFEEAEALVPELPVLWLNKGYTCRQLIVPGSKSPESQKAADCALGAFKRFQELKPADKRGFDLYVQTLFDADRFDELARIFSARQQQSPCDVDAISTLEQVYAKWDKFDEALDWYKKAAECRPNDPEKGYSVGAFIWQRLVSKGGGAPFQSYDPRPWAAEQEASQHARRPAPAQAPPPPPSAYGDIVSQQRIDLADEGIKYLARAVELRPKYQEAMTYLNLLERQKSFAYFDDAPKWQECVDRATEWMKKSLDLLRAAAAAAPSGQSAGPGPAPAHH